MNKMVRKVTDMEAQRMETYRYWLGRTVKKRMDAVEEIVRTAYFARGVDLDSRSVNKRVIRKFRADWKAV